MADYTVWKDQVRGDQDPVLQEEISSRVWVCTSTHSSTKVMVLDASQPSDLLDSFYACNTHVVCIASVPGKQSCHLPCVSPCHPSVIEYSSAEPSLDVFQVFWTVTIQQARRYRKTRRPAKVMGFHWLAVWPVWAPRAAMAPWLQRGPLPFPRLPARV